jgi:MFS family permease
MFGFDIAIISGANTTLQPYFRLSELELGWGTSALLLGAMVGAIISGVLTYKFGRKKLLPLFPLYSGVLIFCWFCSSLIFWPFLEVESHFSFLPL